MSATTAPQAGGQVGLTFGWQGPNRFRGEWVDRSLHALVVDLVFQNPQSIISADIPKNISPSAVQKFPFTDYRCIGCPQSDALQIPIEQIRNLTVKVGIFEKRPHNESISATVYLSGRITYDRPVLRTDRAIPLVMPEALESGQTYRLIVTSKDFSFTAALVRDC